MPDRIITARVSLADRLFQMQDLPCKSREVSLAVTSLQAGRMLLGSVALAMGATNPYPQADNPASKEIAPSADVPPTSPLLKETDPIAAVKELRLLLDGDIKGLVALRRELWARHYGSIEEMLFDRALTELILAKQWLGEQLAVLAGHPLVKAPVKEPLGSKPAASVKVPKDSKPIPAAKVNPPTPAAEPITPEAPAPGAGQQSSETPAAAPATPAA